jgi:DNA modification methylase
MKIETNKIKVNERVRKEFPNIDELAESINDLGLLQPILVNENNELIAGHRRLIACKQLGLKEIECNKINPKSELRQLDMELAENVKREDFNPMELARGLSRRKELYEFEHPETKVGATGKGRPKDSLTDSDNLSERFTQETAKKIGKSETFVKEHLQLNNIKPELQKKVEDNQLKKSQALAIHRKEKKKEELKEEVKEIKAKELNLFQGDCLKELDNIKDDSVSCLIIDPPYGIDYQSNHKLAKYDKIDNDKDGAFELLDKSLEKVKPKMKKDSHVYIFTSWKVYEKIKLIVEKYFEVKNCLIWNKNNWSMGDLNGNYAEKYEMIIFATQGRRILLGDSRPVNVLDFERTTNSNHATEKPVALIKELINNSTVKGELVLDYFAGSGSTLVASKELNRNYIGIELEEENINIIKGRLK